MPSDEKKSYARFRVDRADHELPDLGSVVTVEAIETTTVSVEETRFDTDAGHLARSGIELIRRKGGDDPGWHLTFPGVPDLAPVSFDSRATTAPKEASALLLAVRGGQRLGAVAKIVAVRDVHTLMDPEGAALAHVHDHQMTATHPGGDDSAVSWSHVTIETDGKLPKQSRKALTSAVRDSGATPVAEVEPYRHPVPASGPQPKRLAGLVDAYLQVQLRALALGDVGLRLDADVIHPTRVAVRRIRSTVTVFSDLFEEGPVEELERELSWVFSVLGRVRDADVAAARIEAIASATVEEALSDSLTSDVRDFWSRERAAAVADLRAMLASRRYQALVGTLEQWRVEPPYTTAGNKPKKVAADYVRASHKELRRRLRRASKPGASNIDLHRARKAAKRLRYAAELAEPVIGPSTKMEKQARRWQRRLGDLQDVGITAEFLVAMADWKSGGRRGTEFSLGWLVAEETGRSNELRGSLQRMMR